MINLDNKGMKELYGRKRSGLKESLRRKIRPIAMLGATRLTPDQQWERFTGKSPEGLQMELRKMRDASGDVEGYAQFKRYLNAMLALGRDRGGEDHQYAQLVMGQFAPQFPASDG
jgi:hypothetical protein